MAVDIHFMPQVGSVVDFPELQTGGRGACFLFIIDTEVELQALNITSLQKHIGSIAYLRDTKKSLQWDGSAWQKV